MSLDWQPFYLCIVVVRVLSTGGGGGEEDSPPNTPAPPPPPPPINSVKVVSGTAACSYTCVLCTVSCYTASIALIFHTMSQSASEPLSEGSKFQNFLWGMPPDPPTNCVSVSCQRSARRKSSMTVTCIHTGHYDLNFVSECHRTTLRRLKIPKFSGGACPQTPLQIAYGRNPPSTVILKTFSPKLKILD